jgi:hypothetical protein
MSRAFHHLFGICLFVCLIVFNAIKLEYVDKHTTLQTNKLRWKDRLTRIHSNVSECKVVSTGALLHHRASAVKIPVTNRIPLV